MKKKRFSCTAVIALLLAVLLCIGAITAGWLLFGLPGQVEAKFGPPDPSLGFRQRIYLSTMLLLQANDLTLANNAYGTEQPFTIQLGESPLSIALHLQSQGFISDADAFRNYLIYTGLDTTLQAGDYSLSPGMTPLEIAHQLQDATPAEVTFHILPGWRLEEIAAALPTSGLNITPDEFRQLVESPPENFATLHHLPGNASLEGFMLPGEYEFSREITAQRFITTILETFDSKVSGELIQGFERQGLNLFQAVTLASIVQREAVEEDEMPLIASVFINRLNAGLKLDSDPTVQYALGYNAGQKSWWTNPLSLTDLKIDSPYNTYLYPGLPPGPIANPDLSALRAVAFPAQTPYYYFRAACDGSGKHEFSETFQEHLSKECP
jgi:UPF0755 protein